MVQYEVWIKARDAVTLHLVASVLVFQSADRLVAESMCERAQINHVGLVGALLVAQPKAIISTEMVHP